MKRLLTLVLLSAGALVSGQASAHHSGAMFDDKKTLVFENATVRELQWSNPHAWLEVSIPTATGQENWSLEMVGLGGMRRAGWKFNTVKPGDKIKVTVNPMRDGSKGGRAELVTLANGTVLRGQGPVRAGGAPAE